MNDEQAVCLHCGVEAGKGKSFCHNCGNPVAEEAVICVNCGVALTGGSQCNGSTEGIKPRSLATAIILSIVTCGIYAIVWFVSLTNEINKASGNTNDTSGGMAYFLSLVTCGIYEYYWAYKMGEKRDAIANEKGSSGILYLVLMFLGLGIVVYALLQDALNKAIEKNNP